MNVLVIPGTNRCAVEVISSLSSMKDVTLFGGGSDLGNLERFPYEKYFFIPDISDKKAAISTFTSLISDDAIFFDFVVFTHDQWIYETRCLELTSNTKIVQHNSQAIEITSFKSKTYNFFRELIKTPRIFNSRDEIDSFPIFAKPDRGQGSKGNMVINSAADLNLYLSEHSENYLLCEYLPGKEFTIDCFSNKDSDVIFNSARERTEIVGGIAVSTKSIELPQVNSMAQIISRRLSLCGTWFFQVKQDVDGNLVLMEIGLRAAGASGLQRTRGVNLMAAWIFQQTDANVTIISPNISSEVKQISEKKITAYDKEIYSIYVDLDDTVILPKGGLNSKLVNALIHARDCNILTILITRHFGELEQTLKDHNLNHLFDEVHWVKDGKFKSSFINGGYDFLFIDDSFRERLEVSNSFPNTATCLDQTSFIDFEPDFRLNSRD